MMKYVFAYYNKLGGFYGDPFVVSQKEEFSDILKQSLYVAGRDTLEHLREEELYYLGSFDNESGEIVFAKEFYCSVGPIADEVIAKRFLKEEVKSDVASS